MRNGTADLLTALGPLAGWRGVRATGHRRREDRAALAEGLADGRRAAAARPAPATDRLDTRSPASLDEAFPAEGARRLAERPGIHHTPEHGSWPDMAGVGPGVLARDLPQRIADRPALERQAAARERGRDEARVQADRRLTTAGARIERRRLHPSVQG